MNERAENSSSALLQTIKVPAPFTASHMKVRAFNASAAVTTNVITAKRATSKIGNNAWSG